jgi:hypothetical protein
MANSRLVFQTSTGLQPFGAGAAFTGQGCDDEGQLWYTDGTAGGTSLIQGFPH